MTPRYFKEQICDELDGSCKYLKKAIDCMKTHPEWSKTFKHMSEMEQDHATALYKMFMEMYTEQESKDPWMEQMRDGIMECFSSNMRKIEDLKVTYGLMENTEKKNTVAAPTVSNLYFTTKEEDE